MATTNGTGANTTANVTAGKPRVGGAVYRAAKGAALPTDATTALSDAFKCLGYCSEDGVTNGNGRSSNSVSAWGSVVVLNMLTAGADTLTFTLIEALNAEVLKTVYGSKNVTESDGDIAVTVNGGSDEESIFVFELILRGGAIKRIVIPSAAITELGEIKYNDTEAVGYAVTLTASNDDDGNSHYEYIHKSATSQAD